MIDIDCSFRYDRELLLFHRVYWKIRPPDELYRLIMVYNLSYFKKCHIYRYYSFHRRVFL